MLYNDPLPYFPYHGPIENIIQVISTHLTTKDIHMTTTARNTIAKMIPAISPVFTESIHKNKQIRIIMKSRTPTTSILPLQPLNQM